MAYRRGYACVTLEDYEERAKAECYGRSLGNVLACYPIEVNEACEQREKAENLKGMIDALRFLVSNELKSVIDDKLIELGYVGDEEDEEN